MEKNFSIPVALPLSFYFSIHVTYQRMKKIEKRKQYNENREVFLSFMNHEIGLFDITD